MQCFTECTFVQQVTSLWDTLKLRVQDKTSFIGIIKNAVMADDERSRILQNVVTVPWYYTASHPAKYQPFSMNPCLLTEIQTPKSVDLIHSAVRTKIMQSWYQSFFYLLFYYDQLIIGNLCTLLAKYEVIVSLGVHFVFGVFHQSRVYNSLLSCCALTKRLCGGMQ